MNTLELLRKAREWFEEDPSRWIKGRMLAPIGEMKRACAVGALIIVSERTPEDAGAYENAKERLGEAARAKGRLGSGTYFNDLPDTTFRDIIGLFQKAEELEEANA